MLGLATALAVLLRFRARACVVLACLAAMLCTASIASADASVQTKTRVWDFSSAAPLNIRLNALASAETHPGNRIASLEPASGSPHAARGAKLIDPKTLLRPTGMGNAEFGNLIGWTRGGNLQQNLAQTQQLIKDLPGRVGALRDAGVTKQMAQQWADFYRAEAARVATNPNALPRSRLMQALADLL